MGSDFSALDAELDSLQTGSAVDALVLAHQYASTSLELHQVDAALNAIDADSKLLRTGSSFPPEAVARKKSEAPSAPAYVVGNEEIVLPDPLPRDEEVRHDPGSGEMPLNAASARSGAFAVEPARASFRAPARVAGRDDTLEPFDDELVDAHAEPIEFTAATPSEKDTSGAAPRDSLFHNPDSLFAQAEPHPVDAQAEADAAFAELFSDAAPTRQTSSLPAGEPETYGDDTETFDSSSLGFIENDTEATDSSMDEELDSAEFEIVMDGEGSKAAPARPDAPEKRPSFLGRLFGRKDE